MNSRLQRTDFFYNKPIESNAKNFGCNEHLSHLSTRCKRGPVFNEIVLAKTNKVENNNHGLLTPSTLHINVVAPQDNTLNARNRSCTILHTRACYSNCVCSLINLFKSTFSSFFCKKYLHCSLVTITKSKLWLQVTRMSYQRNIELFLCSSADFNICINATVHEFVR